MVSEQLMRPNKPTIIESAPMLRDDGQSVDWKISSDPVAYPEAIAKMGDRVSRIIAGTEREQVWLLEHTPLYTSGTSARPGDLLTPGRFPVFESGRGGQFTYHGPGQRVAYIMLDLRQRGRDVRRFVANLEAWVIETLAAFNIFAHRSEGRVGVWVNRPDKGPEVEEKIAAIGVRVSRWISFHGISLNVMPDLTHYEGIVPCGITDSGVTSFEDLGHLVSMAEVDMVLRQKFESRFGSTSG
jgi:lipoyl(octanoyl) transferase